MEAGDLFVFDLDSSPFLTFSIFLILNLDKSERFKFLSEIFSRLSEAFNPFFPAAPDEAFLNFPIFLAMVSFSKTLFLLDKNDS